MRTYTLLTLLCGGVLGLTQTAAAQTAITIAAARAQQPAFNQSGATVRLRGVVTNGAELGAIRYMQDGTAGIGVYSATMLTNVVPGDSLEVVGTLKNYRGLLELDPVTSVNVLAGNRPIPAPVVFSAANSNAAYSDQYEGQLVKLQGATSVTTLTGGPVSAFASTTYRLSNNATQVIYINAASNGADGLIGKPAPTGTFDVVGIMSQFTNTSPGVVGYQLLPRNYPDFQQGATPNLLTTPAPTNITTSGFTVNFVTSNPGSTKLEYGTSATGPFTSVDNAASVTQHSLAISGLQPATVYYVKASSTNAVGLSESRVIPMITASLSSGKMRTYFTNTVNNSVALPGNNAVYLPLGRVADTLASYINRAQQTLDIAIYNWNSSTILNAVNAAHARGVQVRVVYENDNANVSMTSLNAAIPRVGRTTTQNIMHNKFVVIDANSTNPNQPWVWTGSTNWTSAQLSTDRNNAILIQDQSLARVYSMEFNEMWGGGTQATALFGSRKTDNTPHYLNIGGKLVESWFSPTDNVNGRLIDLIKTADNDMHVATMLITQSDIGRAIRDQIQLKGIAACSEVLVNDTSSAGSGAIFRTIKQAIGNRVEYFSLNGIMHHKYIIVDAGASQSDPTVFTGSHNWSLSANTENDENTLIVHDARVVNQYYQEFHRRIVDENQNGVLPCNLILATKTAKVQGSNVQVYPNPTSGKFQLRVNGASSRTATITLRDATGRVVLQQTQPLVSGQELTVDASMLKSGLYLVQIATPEATQVSRVVVE
ncbi:T9SS type A sorting domain-containing protein [Hymenobacter busanensis]|uniref:phospholipase D n=1 Tax=Hymenobacter busanensis TaxID=2607656 RepID=A0A7L4ZSR4_9BACT|nr:phospholipase D-like domain-containing protein [Hymenobacter busanensis]KAA9327521.1 T9SS type A sorting domain-containing protein [Hymenobacter busanensis]QHJ06141.1 T9SS type A sorting domain-containing protein [Hymenobacter busanensis]